MPPPLFQENCNYTTISTLGTTTLNPGPASVEPGYFGVFYGFNVLGTGTSTLTGAMGLAAYDIQTALTRTGPVVTTNTLMVGTSSAAGQVLPAGPGQLGMRYRGALVIITSGTADEVNALWD